MAHGQLIHPQRQKHEHLSIGQKCRRRHRHQQIHRHRPAWVGHVGQSGEIKLVRTRLAQQSGHQGHADFRAVGTGNVDPQQPRAFDPVLQGAWKIDLYREERRDEVVHQRLLFAAPRPRDQHIELRFGPVPALAQKPRLQMFGFQGESQIKVGLPVGAGHAARQRGHRRQIAQCLIISRNRLGLAGGGKGQRRQATAHHRVADKVDGKDHMIKGGKQPRIAGRCRDLAHQPVTDPGVACLGFRRVKMGIGRLLHPVVAEKPGFSQICRGVAQDQPLELGLGQGAVAAFAWPIVED